MNKPTQTAELTSLQQLILNEPTQRFILWVIANDDKAFSSYFLIELGKQQQLLQPNAVPNLAKAMVIYQNLLKKRMVDASNPLKTTITWRGQFYRFYTHQSLQMWGIVIGVIVGLGFIKLSCGGTNNGTNKNIESETKPQIEKNVPSSDSANLQTLSVTSDSVVLYHNNRNDTSTKKKPDSTKPK